MRGGGVMEGLLGLLLLGAAALVLAGVISTRSARSRGASDPVDRRSGGSGPPVMLAELADLTHLANATDPAEGSGGGRESRATPTPARGRTRELLQYAGTDARGYSHTGDYAAIALLTTGYAPYQDSVLELAVTRTDGRGHPIERYCTLLRPTHGTGAAGVLDRLRTISPDDLLDAPTFAELAPAVLELLAGAVVVTHHGAHEQGFLATLFVKAGILPEPMPALSLDRFGPNLFGTPNVRTGTLARHLRVAFPVPATAADHADLVAATLPSVLSRLGPSLTYPCRPASVPAGSTQVITPGGARIHGLRRHRPPAAIVTPFVGELLAAAPLSVQELNDPAVAAYTEDITVLLSAGRIVKDEVNDLAQRMARAGTSAEQLRAIAARLLESLREAAFRRTTSPASAATSRLASKPVKTGALTDTELRHLRASATSLGIPGYFDDLIPPPVPVAPEPGSGSFARPVRKPLPPEPPARLPRCGNCLRMGHYTAACPSFGTSRTGAIGPVEPPRRVGPIRPIGPA
ncbi:MAG: hypothetical protein IPL37_14820 [Austwickia sp.]|nr:hypothetical protein [Austwickia sp.]